MPDEAKPEATTETTFTQADVDRIVRERVAREKAKYADYDDLKAKAGTAATVEEKMAALEKRLTEADAKALRAKVQADHGITAEDATLFLTGSDEATLTAQAKALAAKTVDTKKKGIRVPEEGGNPAPSGGDDPMRNLTRGLFANAKAQT
jgi:hypothetical protein